MSLQADRTNNLRDLHLVKADLETLEIKPLEFLRDTKQGMIQPTNTSHN